MAFTHLASTAAIVALLLGGCSTASTTDSGTQPTAPAPSASACDDFSDALERTTTEFADLKAAVGSDNDETEHLGTLTAYTDTLAADAPACAPEAAASLATLRDQTVALTDAYVPGADGAVAEGINTILMEIRTTGEQAWQEMGRPIGAWKELPLHEDGSTLE
jgi:hypothetical protein